MVGPSTRNLYHYLEKQMAKYTGSNIVATFGGVAIGCITGMETSESADVYTVSCAGGSYKSRAVGLVDAQFTLTFVLDTTTHSAELAALAAGSSGAFSASTNTTVGATYAVASAFIESLNTSVPVEGFVTGTVTVGVDGAMTTA